MARIGRYELISEIGRGGMGVVWKAVDPAISRTVAIKVISLKNPESGTQDPQVKERVLREARAAGALSAHPGIVHVHDMGQEGNYAYVVMEFVEGTPLDQWIQAGVPAGRDQQFIRILSDAASALDYAHQCGVIHRDVKPANLIMQKDGQVKIMDFGIAKVTGSQTITKTNMMLGSPYYMTPEQVLGQPVSGKTDQYSLGVIAYMMFAGRRPFESGTFLDLFTKIVQEAPPEITGVPPGVDAAIHRALAKLPADRFPNCTEFVQEIRSAYLPGGSKTRLVQQQKSGGSNNSRILFVVALFLFLILMLGGMGLYMFREQQWNDQVEIEYWESIRQKGDPALFEGYVQQYPSGKFASIAKEQIEKLKAAKSQQKKGPPVNPPPQNNPSVEPAKLLQEVRPEYPSLAKQQKVEGTVRFTARIGVTGRIVDLQFVSGPPLLVDAATAAVRKWVYQPAKLNGKPIETFTNVEVNFTLN